MAASPGMSPRLRLDAELENLERMLPHWRGTLRHESQFWTQFDVLAKELIAKADPADREHAQRCIDLMLRMHLPTDPSPE